MNYDTERLQYSLHKMCDHMIKDMISDIMEDFGEPGGFKKLIYRVFVIKWSSLSRYHKVKWSMELGIVVIHDYAMIKVLIGFW